MNRTRQTQSTLSTALRGVGRRPRFVRHSNCWQLHAHRQLFATLLRLVVSYPCRLLRGLYRSVGVPGTRVRYSCAVREHVHHHCCLRFPLLLLLLSEVRRSEPPLPLAPAVMFCVLLCLLEIKLKSFQIQNFETSESRIVQSIS